MIKRKKNCKQNSNILVYFQINKKTNGHSISISSDDDMIDITTSGTTTERDRTDHNDDFIGHGKVFHVLEFLVWIKATGFVTK